jgi:hypothetical protein
MGKPDPRALQETIRQQRAEIKALRQQVVIFRFHVFSWFLSTPDPKGSCCRNHRKLITFVKRTNQGSFQPSLVK